MGLFSNVFVIFTVFFQQLTSAFQPRNAPRIATSEMFMNGDLFKESNSDNTALSPDSLKPQRYIATNRFKVRKDASPKFEKRWAERKSRLANLDGFRFFTLLRRVNLDGTEYANELGNYMSMTVWEDKDSFKTWLSGDAFKEAHGGGGIGGFIGLLTTALFILDGGPKPAFYDGLLPLFNAEASLPTTKTQEGWSAMEADGVTLLEPDVYVAQNRCKVSAGNELKFESLWANRKSNLMTYAGFIGFYLQRRDATKADDGYNFVTSAIWKDRASYMAWRTVQPERIISTKPENAAPDGRGMFDGAPELAFYEGKLTLLSPLGA